MSKVTQSGTPQIAIISNPKSTQNMKRIEEIRAVLEGAKNTLHFEIDSIADIPEALKIFASTQPAVIIISGGDGTVQATLTAICSNNIFDDVPPIAVLPSGKTNMIAHDLGMKGKPDRVLAEIITDIQKGNPQSSIVRKFLIEMKVDENKPSQFGMFFGGAAMVNGIQYCRDKIYPMKLPNFISHFLVFFTLSIASLRRGTDPKSPLFARRQSIIMPGAGRLEGRFVTIVATTLNRLLLGWRPYGHDGSGPIGFSAVDHNPSAVFAAFKALISGAFGRKTIVGVNTRRATEIRITGDDPVTLDGEIYEVPIGGTVLLRASRSLPFYVKKS